MISIVYLNGFGFGMSFDWSSQTGAGSRNGGCGGGGGGVVVGGRIGPVFVLKSTRIENAVEINTKTNRTHNIICNKKINKNKFKMWKLFFFSSFEYESAWNSR